MATRGPKPKPTALKVLQGNPGKRELRQPQPSPDALLELPEPPPFLGEEARTTWFETGAQLLKLRLLTEVDFHAFALLCVAQGRLEVAEKALRDQGLTLPGPGGRPMKNPHVAIVKQAFEQVHKLSAEFGLTPSSRARGVAVARSPAARQNPFRPIGGKR